MNSPTRSSQRKYGSACLTCRRRKIRCGGEKPRCENCLRFRRACSYTVKSSDEEIARLLLDLERAQARAEKLEGSLRTLAGMNAHERDRSIIQVVESLRGERRDGERSAGSSAARIEEVSPRLTELDQPELSIDKSGELEYFGATSRFYTQLHNKDGSHPTSNRTSVIDIDYHRKWLSSNSRFYVSWRQSAYASLRNDPELTTDAASVLLDIYWTWQGPLHNCVYRHNFLRDVVLQGPYFSPFLLNVIYAHACRHARPEDTRFSRFDKGEHFVRKAKLLLVEELGANKPSIPTIQGLLILGGRQCAVGKNSEGWLYTGMAIRMIKDLGMHLTEGHGLLHSQLEPDNLEASKRLYLAAYTWDKSISLCLGRPPSLPEMPYSPDCMLDKWDDNEIWRPVYMPEVESVYPPHKAMITTTFSCFCRLSMFANEIYRTVYSGRRSDLTVDTVLDLERRLLEMHENLPEMLRLTDLESLSFCPPPHILSLNIFWHTLTMLLFRPFFLWSTSPSLSSHTLTHRARRVCTTSASRVNDLFRLHGRTFNFHNQTYLMTYSVYTAATIELQQIRDPDPELSGAALRRLETTLRMLESEAQQTPGVRRSIDIIRSHLASAAGEEEQIAGEAVVEGEAGQAAWPDWGGYDFTFGFFPDGAHWNFYDMSLVPRT
ncbi:fungal specific transcription factor domain-containing protein [Sarocladium implicatum]|nr:fungal specific transcription factor domain-containing protein [Sarocladium implicatum]